MSFVIIDAEQRSPEWFKSRLGRLTGSKAGDVLAKIKIGEAAARRDYRLQLAIERITDKPAEDTYINAAMQRGIDLEPAARAAYEAQSGNLVRQTGFLQSNEFMAGCSLDGDISNFEGLLEIKCPKSATHISYIMSGSIPKEYEPQLTHAFWITGAIWCDFVSYDDRMPEDLAYFCKRCFHVDFDIEGYEKSVIQFLSEVDASVESLNKLRKVA